MTSSLCIVRAIGSTFFSCGPHGMRNAGGTGKSRMRLSSSKTSAYVGGFAPDVAVITACITLVNCQHHAWSVDSVMRGALWTTKRCTYMYRPLRSPRHPLPSGRRSRQMIRRCLGAFHSRSSAVERSASPLRTTQNYAQAMHRMSPAARRSSRAWPLPHGRAATSCCSHLKTLTFSIVQLAAHS